MSKDGKIVAKLGCHELADCQDYEIETFKAHQMYSKIHDDIAILRTRKEITMTKSIGAGSVKAIQLANDARYDYKVGDLLTVAGWGESDINRTLPYVPMKLELTTISAQQCKIFNKWVDTWEVCTWSPSGNPCEGDEGAPLFRTHRGLSTQIGIVAFGDHDCGDTATGDVFTRVAAYSEWIADTIQGFEQLSN